MRENELTEVKRIESAEGHPDGEWDGVWSGYVVRWETEHGQYEAKSKNGVRGINVSCVVTVTNGQFSCKAKSRRRRGYGSV